MSRLQDLTDRVLELPSRLRQRPPGTEALSWPLTTSERQRVAIAWPSVWQWAPSATIVETLRDALGRLCEDRTLPTAQPHKGVINLSCFVDGHTYLVALDYSDYTRINADALAECALYIKLQYRRGGYGDDRVVAGGYPVSALEYYKYYMGCRAIGAASSDVRVLGRFGFRFHAEFRRKAVALLAGAPELRFVGAAGKVRYRRFLRESAAARLALDLPGNGPFTHRVAEFLGVGTCMVALQRETVLHVPLEPGVHFVEVKEDLSDLVDVCRYYVANRDARERIAHAGQTYFDRYLHCDQLAAYYVRMLLDRFGKRAG